MFEPLNENNEQPKVKWLVIVSTALITILIVYAIAFFSGFLAHQTIPINTFKSQVEAKDFKIRGNKSSRIYHLPNCPNYNDIAPHNIYEFKLPEEAEAMGYRKAKNCP